MVKMSLAKIVKSSVWLYGSNLVNNLFGFAYWFIISAIGGPEILGVTSSIIGLAGLVSGFLSFGIGIGLVRFVGKSIGDRDEASVSAYFWSALLFFLLVYLSTGLTLIVLSFLGFSFSNFSSSMLRFVGIMVLLAFVNTFNSFLMASLRTDLIFKSNLVGNLLKLATGVGLVLLGWGWVGAVIGYMAIQLTNLVILGFESFKRVGLKIIFKISNLKNLFKAGIVSWLPGIVALAGQWLGVLFVFGSSGAYETGLYYVAFSIANVVFMSGMSLSSMLLPVLSGMEDGRKRTTWRVIRVGLSLTWPLAVFIGTYPWLPLSLLGESYLEASPVLELLMLNLVAILLSSSISNLSYAYGLYRYVLLIGLAQNIPRVFLYYILVSCMGMLGAALSFTIGAFLGVIVAVFVASRIGFHIRIGEIATIAAVPPLLAFLVLLLNIHFVAGGLIIYGLSILLFLKLNILQWKDLSDIAESLLPGKLQLIKKIAGSRLLVKIKKHINYTID
ncbi:MAG: hypothetical protein DRN68_08820 [Thaumarchaeota archaeon]|nr:MAG: hypothetical protein DRN68_08820 [Nitrososphaerota archaeon]